MTLGDYACLLILTGQRAPPSKDAQLWEGMMDAASYCATGSICCFAFLLPCRTLFILSPNAIFLSPLCLHSSNQGTRIFAGLDLQTVSRSCRLDFLSSRKPCGVRALTVAIGRGAGAGGRGQILSALRVLRRVPAHILCSLKIGREREARFGV
ncbi:hypothetical protein BC628DRAFT_201708 [Trametes gibbosa]|nr:hypothetical protein BC628DRAFT_201708 [Trametes gibbosa]